MAKQKKVVTDWTKIEGRTVSLYLYTTDDGWELISTSIGQKDENDEWENLYLTVRFSKAAAKKCIPDHDGAYYCYISEGWLKAEFWDSGKGRNKERRSALVLFINDGQIVE